jgi:hypothetical protein
MKYKDLKMAIDLKSMTRKELEKLRTNVDRELKRTIERDKKSAIAASIRLPSIDSRM